MYKNIVLNEWMGLYRIYIPLPHITYIHKHGKNIPYFSSYAHTPTNTMVCTDTAEQRHTYIHTVLSNTIAPHILCSCVFVCLWGSTVFSLVLFSMLGIFSTDSGTHVTFKTFRDYPNSILHVWVCARDLPSLTIVSSKRFQHHQLIDSLSTWLTDTLMYVIKWHCFLAFISIEMSFNADI